MQKCTAYQGTKEKTIFRKGNNKLFFFYTQTQLLTDSNVFFLKILFILFDLFDDIDIIIVLYCVNHLNR